MIFSILLDGDGRGASEDLIRREIPKDTSISHPGEKKPSTSDENSIVNRMTSIYFVICMLIPNGSGVIPFAATKN